MLLHLGYCTMLLHLGLLKWEGSSGLWNSNFHRRSTCFQTSHCTEMLQKVLILKNILKDSWLLLEINTISFKLYLR